MTLLLEAGQTLVCLGDSITEAQGSYVDIVSAFLQAKYPSHALTVINAGMGGHTSNDMRERLDRDVLAYKPDWVTVSAGINDAGRFLGWDGQGVTLDEYTENMEQIVRAIQQAKARVVLLEPTIIGEDPEGSPNHLVRTYCDAVRAISKRNGTLLAPMHTDFIHTLKQGRAANPDFRMTTDTVHLNEIGNARMALTLLNTLDF